MQVLFFTHVIFFSDGKAIFFLYPAFANPRDGSPQEIDDPNAKLFFYLLTGTCEFCTHWTIEVVVSA